MRIHFTGKDDPFMVGRIGGITRTYSRQEAVEFCDQLAKEGLDRTKKICRVVRTVLRNQKPSVELSPISE